MAGLLCPKANDTEPLLLFEPPKLNQSKVLAVQWSLYWYANVFTLDEFASMAYNVVHIVLTGDLGSTPFNWEELQLYVDRLGFLLQFDVRWDLSNLTFFSHPCHPLRWLNRREWER